MKRVLVVMCALSCALILASCVDKEKQDLRKMEKNLRGYLEDDAFKNNAKVEFLELKVLSYFASNENQVDSARMLGNEAKLKVSKERGWPTEKYEYIDAELRGKIAGRNHPKECYFANYYIKATYTYGSGYSENVMEERNIAFDSECNVMPLLLE